MRMQFCAIYQALKILMFACLLCFVSFSYCYFILFLGCQWSPAKGGLGNSNNSATWDHSSRYIIIAAPLLYGIMMHISCIWQLFSVFLLGRLFTQYNVQQVLEMEWHDLYCMLLVNHSLYLMLCSQSSEVTVFVLIFVTFIQQPHHLISSIYVFEQLLMRLLFITQVINVSLMLLLLCRERRGSLVS